MSRGLKVFPSVRQLERRISLGSRDRYSMSVSSELYVSGSSIREQSLTNHQENRPSKKNRTSLSRWNGALSRQLTERLSSLKLLHSGNFVNAVAGIDTSLNPNSVGKKLGKIDRFLSFGKNSAGLTCFMIIQFINLHFTGHIKPSRELESISSSGDDKTPTHDNSCRGQRNV